MRRWALALLGLLACSPFEPTGAVPFTPPPAYRALWAAVEQCSGLHGSFDRVQWFEVPGETFAAPSGPSWGYWTTDHVIYLAQGVRQAGWQDGYVDEAFVVKHEILHELLGHPGHPAVPFTLPCALHWGGR